MQIFVYYLQKISSLPIFLFPLPVALTAFHYILSPLTHHTLCNLYISSRTFLALNTPSHRTSTILRFHKFARTIHAYILEHISAKNTRHWFDVRIIQIFKDCISQGFYGLHYFRKEVIKDLQRSS